MGIRVIIADDHAVVRDGIKAMVARIAPDVSVVGEAATGFQLLDLARNTPADVYVVDISMPELNGLESISRLLRLNAQAKILVVSMHDDRNFIEKALTCGAKGYIVKDTATEDIVNGIHSVSGGTYFLSPRISKLLPNGFMNKLPLNGTKKIKSLLTRREKEILQLIAEGFTNKEVAKKLGMALNTAHVHRNNIMRKLNIHRHADLVRYALKEGFTHL